MCEKGDLQIADDCQSLSQARPPSVREATQGPRDHPGVMPSFIHYKPLKVVLSQQDVPRVLAHPGPRGLPGPALHLPRVGALGQGLPC